MPLARDSISGKTVMLVSADTAFTTRVCAALKGNERLIRVASPDLMSTWRGPPPDLLVVDWRALPQHRIDSGLPHLQAASGTGTLLAIITAATADAIPEAVGFYLGRPTAVLISDHPAIGVLVRSHMNNAPHGALAVTAATAVLRRMPDSALGLLNSCIGSGFTASSVKCCAQAMDLDRATIRRQIQRSGSSTITPGSIVRMAKVAFAVLLLREGTGSAHRIARVIGLASGASLGRLLVRTVGATPAELAREKWSGNNMEYLDAILFGANCALERPRPRSLLAGAATMGNRATVIFLLAACLASATVAPTVRAQAPVVPAKSSEIYRATDLRQPASPLANSGSPRYPSVLKAAEIQGEVVVEFVVDTVGRPEMATFTVIRSSHALFTNSVNAFVTAMRFRPAEHEGRKVRQYVEVPFAFKLP